MNHKRHYFTALLVGVLSMIQPLSASDRLWTNAVSGPFSGTGNQWNTVPGTGDTANFNVGGTDFTVTLVGHVTNQYMRINGSSAFTLTLDLAGYNYTTTQGGGGAGDTTSIARSGGDNNTLNIQGGGKFTSYGFIISANATATGKVAVSGTGTELSVNSSDTVVGYAGTGTLEIKNKAKFTSDSVVALGRAASSVGTLLINDATWTANNEARIGYNNTNSTGHLIVTNGGKVSFTGTSGSTGYLSFGDTGTATGLITGAGSEISTKSIIAIGGRGNTVGGSADVTVEDGGKLITTNALNIFSNGSLSVEDALVSAGTLGNSSASVAGEISLTLSGLDPLMEISGNVYLDGSAATLDLSLQTGASYSANDVIRLIEYGGTLSGTFSNYTEGQIFKLDDYDFQFGYALTNGSDTFIGLTFLSHLYWTADGSSLGGAGTWNTSGTNWSLSKTSVSGAAWNDAKTAVFTNDAATVTVDAVTAKKGILFATTGYTLEDGTIVLGGTNIGENTITTDASVTAAINSVLDGTNGFTKAGAGTLILGGDNTFSGGAAVQAGTLELNTDSGSALGNVTSVAVDAGATLLLSKSGQVNNAAAVTLSGGTIERASGVSETFGDLNLTEASFLDYGTGVTGTLTFGAYTPSSLLTVSNFLEGNVLVFSSNLSGSINNGSLFSFDNGFNYNWDGGAGTFTITAIPEPSACVVAVGLIGLMLWRRAKRA